MESATTAPTDRREQLLESIVDHVLDHGIARLTLRGLASAVGSNNRMLLYYFGSLEDLVITALHRAEVRFPTMTTILVDVEAPGASILERLNGAWATIADPANRPFHRLFFEVFGLAGYGQERFRELLGVIGTEWADSVARAYVAEGVAQEQAEALAHETVALWRGLQATLLSTGDDALVSRAALPALAALAARVGAARV
ncbi:TetR/AcrR family transcriptional regulator [Frondihabitans australicus]|uniref:TetR family transcriptional regulator n=1 Tax=Frondihabitans australicus TaxID=386892 RepID=A0A495IIA2_9MICO|nr:TetR/AcrR family transcriptional regulator [Frondihabitans australicus]RKR75031.1 TetR family transcriptional regulator [Frondihabitans australicus]